MPDNGSPPKQICKCCNTEITASMGVTREGEDYLYHFCGDDCVKEWDQQQKNDSDDKSER